MPSQIPAGWAITHDWDKKNIAYIDTGNDKIYVVDVFKDFKVLKEFQVTEVYPSGMKGGVSNINEIEYIKGDLWANKWMTNFIYRFDKETGETLNKFDFSVLHKRAEHLHGIKLNGQKFGTDDVFNGIAYDRVNDTIYVTGKNWQK